MKNIFSIAVAGICLTACAGPQSTGVYASRASYEHVFTAAVNAVPATGYLVTQADKTSGLIAGQQSVVLGRGSLNGMSALVLNNGNTREIRVTFTGAPGSIALGNFDENVTQYINAVRLYVPDIHAEIK